MKRRPHKAFFEAPRPHLFAHRGGAKLSPENTLAAFELGRSLGCDFIETDVHLTRDGEVVVIHDARVDRTTDGEGVVAQMSLAQIKGLVTKAPAAFNAATQSAHARCTQIPSLTELFAWLAEHPSVRVNIELKTPNPLAATKLLAALDAHGLTQRCLVASSDTATVRHFRSLCAGRVATSAGTSEIAVFYAAVKARLWRWVPIAYDALQIPVLHKGLHVCTPNFVSAAHARGVQVHVWTIDDPAQMRALLEMGVDGLMTDRPDLLTSLARSAVSNS